MRSTHTGLLLLCLACSSGPAAPAGLRDGRLTYRGYNTAGEPVLKGSIQLEFHDDTTLTGSWSIAWVAGADTTQPVGPQVGTGALVGSRRQDTLWIELNPHVADNNIGLQAVATRSGWKGEWVWSGFPGLMSQGRFTATR
jgi:hypothetical protein